MSPEDYLKEADLRSKIVDLIMREFLFEPNDLETRLKIASRVRNCREDIKQCSVTHDKNGNIVISILTEYNDLPTVFTLTPTTFLTN